MTAKMEIDQEILITLVHERPVLWDKSTEEYKDKRLKYDTWKDIYKQLNPNFEDLDGEEKNEFGKLVMKKWTNMKDNWIKYNNKMDECKSGSRANKIRKYIYYDQMLFLKKIVELRKTKSNMGNSNDNIGQYDENPENENKRKKRKSEPSKLKKKKVGLSEVDIKFMKFMDTTERDESSRIMNFFRGIAPTVDRFNEDNMIDFQFQVLSIIKTIKQKEQAQNKISYWYPSTI